MNKVMFISEVLLLYILCGGVADVSSQQYAKDVNKLFKQHFTSENNICWKKAQAESNNHPYFDEDTRHAVQLVNVYTQECVDYMDYIPNTDRAFYAKLNKQLRSGHPEPIWVKTKTLLNKGLDMLGSTTWNNLYRGCRCNGIKEGGSLPTRQFWSTSVDPEVPVGFLDSTSVYFKIKTAPKGTNITIYSDALDEQEVLLQPGIVFSVKQYITTKKKIAAEMKKLGIDDMPDIKAFAVITKDASSIGKRAVGAIGTCDCSSPIGVSKGSTLSGLNLSLALAILHFAYN